MGQIRLNIVGDCSIEVDGRCLTPTSTHMFALVLLLSIERHFHFSRSELQALLFGEDTAPRLVSHRLRQLLYRLRQLGVEVDDRPSGISLNGVEVTDPLSRMRERSRETRARLDQGAIAVLPSYSPKLSSGFSDWLDRTKDSLTGQIRSLLLGDLRAFRASHDWSHLSSAACTAQVLDPWNEEIAIARAEALEMLGRRTEALTVLDLFRDGSDGGSVASAESRHLKSRILRSPVVRREGILRGRAVCMSSLENEWHRSSVGGARLSVLVGVAGLGKTRAANDFAAMLALGSGRVIYYRCDRQSQLSPLSLFSHLLPELRAMRGSLGAAPQYVGTLDLLRPTLEAAPSTMPLGLTIEILRAELQAALVDMLEAVSSEQRILLVVDDAHFLDSASCATLQILSTSVNSAALLVLACCRPGGSTQFLLERGERSASHVLAPLGEEDSQQLFREFVADRPVNEQEVNWCVNQSAGNPFYLRALAQHHVNASGNRTPPVDVHSLAASSYFALDPATRLVLDSCIFLGRFATLFRVGAVAALGEMQLISSLRHMEEQGLVSLVGNSVRGPHSLLHDAIRDLVPLTVAALLHGRIARLLADECRSKEYSTTLALAAADSWIAAGDANAALNLIQRCASEVAAIGEPAAAADLLSRMKRSDLPPAIRIALLDDLVAYAEAGGSRVLVADSLRERLLIARSIEEPTSTIRLLELRIVQADILNGSDLALAVITLDALLDFPDSDSALRTQALISLLVIADAEYDAPLAHRLIDRLEALSNDETIASVDLLRARLVFHTTFGSTDHAKRLVDDLIRQFPVPTLSDDCRTARRFASFALYRLQCIPLARHILEADYSFMNLNTIRSEAMYSASLLTEIAIIVGDFDTAARWFAETERHLRGATAHKLSPNSGYYSSAALLEMMKGDYALAEELIALPQLEDSRMKTARYESICIALRLRLYLYRGGLDNYHDLIGHLRTLYERGRALGGQDSIVEMLWCAEVLAGREEAASLLLRDYLSLHRRETSKPEWQLQHTTAADPAWDQWCTTTVAPV